MSSNIGWGGYKTKLGKREQSDTWLKEKEKKLCGNTRGGDNGSVRVGEEREAHWNTFGTWSMEQGGSRIGTTFLIPPAQNVSLSGINVGHGI